MNYAIHIGYIEGNVVGPCTELAGCVDRLDPLAQCFTFGNVSGSHTALRFQHKGLAVIQPDQIIRDVLADNALVDVYDFKAQMVILGLCLYMRVLF